MLTLLVGYENESEKKSDGETFLHWSAAEDMFSRGTKGKKDKLECMRRGKSI